MGSHDHGAVEAVFTEVDDGVLVVNRERTVLYANPAASRLLGVADCDLVGQPPPFSLPEGRAGEIVLPGGTALELRCSPTVWREQPARLVFLRDITESRDLRERRQDEAHLRLFGHIVEHTNDAIITTDLAGTILSWNPGAERMYGYTTAEVLGKSITILYPPDQLESLREQIFTQTLTRGRQTVEIPSLHKDGWQFDVYLSLGVLTDSHGTPYGLVGYSIDMTERKRAEAVLRKWESIFHSTRIGVAVCTPGSMTLELVNPAFAELHGYRVEELTGKPFTTVVAAEAHDGIAAYMQAANAQGHQTTESKHVRKDGTDLWVQTDITVVEDAHGRILYYVLNAQDITERKRAEEALLQSEQRYRALAQNLPDSDLFLFDRDLRFLTVEGKHMHRYGASPERYLGKRVREVMDEEAADFTEGVYRRTLAGEACEGMVEHQAHIYQYRTVPLRDEHGQVSAGMLMWQDITKLKHIEREVRSLNTQLEELLQRERQARADAEDQRALLRGILDQAPAMMCMLQGPEHVFQYVNERYCQAMEREPGDLVGRPFRDALPRLAMSELSSALDQVYRTGQPLSISEHALRLDAGQHDRPGALYLSSVYQPTRDAAGRVIGVLVHAIDVTAHVCAKQALEQKSDEIARLNRDLEQRVAERTAELIAVNAELESFSYSVSHDLRAPLRRIDGFSQILLAEHKDELDEEAQHHLERIRSSSQHMGELIDDLLALAKVSRVELEAEAVDLGTMAREILAVLQEQAPERQVTLTIEPAVVAWADPRLVRIALENLLNNAWKFTSKTQGATIEVGAQVEDGVTVFFVRDNGAGFDPQFRAKLFGTFSRLHSPAEFPGTGIGLATVKRVIDRHGGRIWAEGEVGRGAAFYFTLPEASRVYS